MYWSITARRSPTPEGTVPISKRRRAVTAWDVKAPGFEQYTAEQAKLTGMFVLPGNNSMAAMQHGSGGIMGNTAITFKPMQGTVGPGAPIGSALRQARRLYIGNITPETTEENLAIFFNRKMVEMNLVTEEGLGEDLVGIENIDASQPVISTHVNFDRSYAFVEFRNATEATNALAFDGIIFQNSALKVRRPKDYGMESGMPVSGQPHIPGVVGTNVPDTINKIFIGGLPSYLTDDQVMDLLKSFGELRAFHLVKEPGTGQSKGFAFCEYVDPSMTEPACQGLNGMELGDRVLVVQRAALGNQAQRRDAYGNIVPGAGLDLKPAGDESGGESRVLQLLNMVSIEELANQDDYNDIVEDIREECNKYGKVEDVKIPKPIVTGQGKVDVRASESVKNLGKVFVLFDTVESTSAAMKAIAGRQFGGRTIIATFAPLEVLLEGDAEQDTGGPAAPMS